MVGHRLPDGDGEIVLYTALALRHHSVVTSTNDLELWAKTHHEAGHAVIGLRLGIRVCRVAALEDPSGGTTAWDKRTVTPKREIMLLLAGAAAQARCFPGFQTTHVGQALVAFNASEDERRIDELLQQLAPDADSRSAIRTELATRVESMLDDPVTWETVRVLAGVLASLPFVGEDLLLRIYADKFGGTPNAEADSSS